MGEQWSPKPKVVGSNPTTPANQNHTSLEWYISFAKIVLQ